MIPDLPALGDHLWQSTALALTAGLLTLALRKNHARARHALWLAASLKFLIPFSLLIALGGHLGWRASVVRPHAKSPGAALSMAIAEIGEPFAAAQLSPAPAPAPSSRTLATLIVWGCGSLITLWFWAFHWRRVDRIARNARPLTGGREQDALRKLQVVTGVRSRVRLAAPRNAMEPGVFGVFRPVLLLPDGIASRLTDEQMDAILAHELCHIRRRDNLTAAIHMVVEAAFWFHPLVWFIGSRMMEERERACDEDVLRLGHPPEVYAEGILRVCEYYVASPVACVSGVSGADLKHRIEDIMINGISRNLSPGRKLLLAAGGIAAVSLPLVIGILNPPRSQAQTAAKLEFEVASIKPSPPGAGGIGIRTLPGGGLRARNIPLKRLIATAYSVTDYQIASNAGSLDSPTYDVDAKAAGPVDLPQIRLMVQSLLDDRFKLKFHRETRESPIYSLVFARKGVMGPNLVEDAAGDCAAAVTPQDPPPGAPTPRAVPCGTVNPGRGQMNGRRARISQLADRLSSLLGRTVVDKTGLLGMYDLSLTWSPNTDPASQMAEPPAASDLSDVSIFTALQEQLGLKLEAGKGPLEVIVVDSMQKLAGN